MALIPCLTNKRLAPSSACRLSNKIWQPCPGATRACLAPLSSLAASLQHILSYVIHFNVRFWNPRRSIILNGRACGFISQTIHLRQKQRSMVITCRSKRISRYTLWKDCRGIMKKKEKNRITEITEAERK